MYIERIANSAAHSKRRAPSAALPAARLIGRGSAFARRSEDQQPS
jgi:hypothetical protein